MKENELKNYIIALITLSIVASSLLFIGSWVSDDYFAHKDYHKLLVLVIFSIAIVEVFLYYHLYLHYKDIPTKLIISLALVGIGITGLLYNPIMRVDIAKDNEEGFISGISGTIFLLPLILFFIKRYWRTALIVMFCIGILLAFLYWYETNGSFGKYGFLFYDWVNGGSQNICQNNQNFNYKECWEFLSCYEKDDIIKNRKDFDNDILIEDKENTQKKFREEWDKMLSGEKEEWLRKAKIATNAPKGFISSCRVEDYKIKLAAIVLPD